MCLVCLMCRKGGGAQGGCGWINEGSIAKFCILVQLKNTRGRPIYTPIDTHIHTPVIMVESVGHCRHNTTGYNNKPPYGHTTRGLLRHKDTLRYFCVSSGKLTKNLDRYTSSIIIVHVIDHNNTHPTVHTYIYSSHHTNNNNTNTHSTLQS